MSHQQFQKHCSPADKDAPLSESLSLAVRLAPELSKAGFGYFPTYIGTEINQVLFTKHSKGKRPRLLRGVVIYRAGWGEDLTPGKKHKRFPITEDSLRAVLAVKPTPNHDAR